MRRVKWNEHEHFRAIAPDELGVRHPGIDKQVLGVMSLVLGQLRELIYARRVENSGQ